MLRAHQVFVHTRTHRGDKFLLLLFPISLGLFYTDADQVLVQGEQDCKTYVLAVCIFSPAQGEFIWISFF